jgi:hypothetical protein
MAWLRLIFTSLSLGLVVVCLLLAAFDLSSTTSASAPRVIALPIVPFIRGFGTTTPAGSGRHTHPIHTTIRQVSSLNDSGPGTLRECIEQRGPRICLFEVAGEIELHSALRIRNPYITIAGQTAPPPGITISHGGVVVETHDVLLQHLAIRPGDFVQGVPAQTRDGISVGGSPPRDAYNIVLDNLSISWAIDENISTWHPSTHDVTLAHSIIAEGLHRSIHPKGPHSKGVMIGNGSSRITLFKNLIAANDERNPYLKPGTSTEMINNVVYGWGSRGPWTLCNLTNNDGSNDPLSLSFIGNTYVAGPWSFIAPPVYARQLPPLSRIYLHDNQFVSDATRTLQDWQATSLPEHPYRSTSPPLASSDDASPSSKEAYGEVLRLAGSRPFNRSRVDRRIVRQVTRRRGSIKDCIRGCKRSVGRWPAIPRTHRSLRLPDRPHDDDNNDGYTNIENWLFQLAAANSE